MEKVIINEGMPAKLTILDPQQEWTLNRSTNFSKSENSPFWNQKIKGAVVGTINGTHYNI